MADSYRPLFEGLKETAAALTQAGEASQQAIEASQQAIIASHLSIAALQRAGARITQMADVALQTREEQEDLRETVHRLEGLVIQLSTEVRALRDARPENGVH